MYYLLYDNNVNRPTSHQGYLFTNSPSQPSSQYCTLENDAMIKERKFAVMDELLVSHMIDSSTTLMYVVDLVHGQRSKADFIFSLKWSLQSMHQYL